MKEFVEKLIGRLEERSKEYNSGVRLHGKPEEMLTHEAISIVNQLAEEYEREHIVDLGNKICDKVDDILRKRNNGWIPCSEKMPLFIDNVLVCTKSGGRTVACLTNGKRFCDTYMNIIDNVVAWMPLPPAYVTEERGK